MRIGIDARLSGRKNAGIGRYIENLLLRLPLEAAVPSASSSAAPAANSEEITWVYFFSDKSQLADLMQALGQIALPKHLTAANFFQNIEIVYAPIKHYSLAEQTQWPKIIRAQKLDLLHVPHFNVPIFYGGPMVVTIHDLLWHEKKGLHVTTLNPLTYYLKYLFYRIVARAAVSKARKIFVPARTVAQTVTQYYPHAARKIIITPEGFYQAQPLPLSTKLLRQLPPAATPFLLYVGSLYPHKNIQVVLEALQLEAQKFSDSPPAWQLVIVGSRNVFLDKVKEQVAALNLQDRVQFVGFVPDAQLATLYHRSLALVQPSLSEGFGLTGLEAMSQGAPVLASDIPIFHEVYGQAALFFNPHRPADLLKKIYQLTPAKTTHLIEAGFRQAQKYDWQVMTQQTFAGYLTANHV